MRFLIADSETIGLSPPPQPASGVVEAAWLEVDGSLNIIGRFNSLVDPEAEIHPEAQAIHGISALDVMGKPKLADIFEEHFPKTSVCLIGHNISYDLKFFGPYIPILGASLCTLAMARRQIKGSLNHKLTTLKDFLGLPDATAHSAAGDVATTYHLLQHLLNLSGRTLEAEIAASTVPKIYNAMPFGKYKGVPFAEIPKWYIRWFLEQEGLPLDLAHTLKRFESI